MFPHKLLGRTLIDVVKENNICWISLSSNYPDDSLPWVLAQNLVGQNIDESMLFPVVLDGFQIASPNGTIEKLLSSYDVETLCDQHGCQPVVIVSEPVLTTRNRQNHLAKQIALNPNFKFILVSREESKLYDADSIVKKVGGRLYTVDRISFQELAMFLQKAFQMEPQKAEVLAGRLDNTFAKFDLHAHPTYFAGIPESILIAFLQANRRSELIQLAVDGFLTFLVADDVADVALSRTTRQVFLRKLAYQINVEVKSITKVELVNQAAAFAEEMDYKIDAARYVDDFFKFGILGETGKKIEFLLPFVESYLLALEIVENKGSEKIYFDFTSNDIDLATFDLYFELSPDNVLIGPLSVRPETL